MKHKTICVDKKMLTNLRKGALGYCLLAVLRGGEMYGLDIAKRMSGLGLLAGEGTVYPLLSNLRKSGLVTSAWHEAPSGRMRRYYAITESGRESVELFTSVWGPFSDSVSLILKEGSQ
jgi:PadR family transcriptional regulator PadR